ncbi:MAG: nuclear transport factor 2 family protein [Candidatus Methanofastidiosia archaeon]
MILEGVKAYERAYNSHDFKKIMSLYAEDATFEVVGQFVLKGKEKIRDITEYDIALNIHMSFSGCIKKGDKVICELAETNDWLKTAGIIEAYYSAKFVFSDGLVKLIRAEATPETRKAFSQVINPLMQWAHKERPQQLTEMIPTGEFVYGAESARRWLTLLREWREVTRFK